jgi:hypothetical protein
MAHGILDTSVAVKLVDKFPATFRNPNLAKGTHRSNLSWDSLYPHIKVRLSVISISQYFLKVNTNIFPCGGREKE